MKKHSIVISVTMIFILVLALATVAMAADPHVGTWKLNLGKSKYNPGPAPKSGMVTITAQDNGIKSVSDGVDADGKAIHSEFAAKYDGKDYPVTGRSYDTIALTRVDANTITLVPKKGGKAIGRGRVAVSKDGKTRTVTGKGKDANGHDTSFTMVYDKQ